MDKDELIERAQRWVERHGCPLPVDLVTDLIGAGVDALELEDQLLEKSGL